MGWLPGAQKMGRCAESRLGETDRVVLIPSTTMLIRKQGCEPQLQPWLSIHPLAVQGSAQSFRGWPALLLICPDRGQGWG